jgi:mRNA interferase HicA
MKRRALLKHLRKQGCELFREGSRHSVYWNPQNGKTSTIPRHVEIKDVLAIKICKDLGVPSIS